MNEYKTKALEIISAWETMTGREQRDFCRNCIRRSIREGRKLKPGNEIDDAINDTYIKVAERLADADKLARNIERRANKGFSDSLPAIICRAANAVLQRQIDQAERESMTVSDATINSSGQEYSLFERIAGTADTEKAAVIRATLKDFYAGLDATNKIIFNGMAEGKTERELAPTVSLSNVAIHKRMTKIRTALATLF